MSNTVKHFFIEFYWIFGQYIFNSNNMKVKFENIDMDDIFFFLRETFG